MEKQWLSGGVVVEWRDTDRVEGYQLDRDTDWTEGVGQVEGYQTKNSAGGGVQVSWRDAVSVSGLCQTEYGV